MTDTLINEQVQVAAPPMKTEEPSEDYLLHKATVMLNFKVLGLVLGLLLGLLLFIATNWLIIKGPDPTVGSDASVGPHLQLLGQFLLGYSVTFWGSIVGFFYGFAFGSLSGALLSFVYNLVTTRRSGVSAD